MKAIQYSRFGGPQALELGDGVTDAAVGDEVFEFAAGFDGAA